MSIGEPIPGQRGQTRGFLFADLRGYSAFTERNGDEAARQLLRRYRELVRKVISQVGGAEIRTEGDSFYVVFLSVGEAVQAGLAILVAAAADDPSAHPIQVGIGVHAGETVDSTEGIVSSAVNIAARICSAADAGELLVSDTVRALTRTHLDASFVPRGRRRLKGIAEPVSLYQVQRSGASPQAPRDRLAALAGRWRTRAGVVTALVVLVLVTTIIGAAMLREGLGGAPEPSGSALLPTGAEPPAGGSSAGSVTPPLAGRIAFTRTDFDSFESQIQSIQADGNRETQLTRADAVVAPGFPVWRPDGQLLAFNQNVEVPDSDQMALEVFTMNPDGTGVRQMTHSDQILADPAWSPDGSAVAVTVPDVAAQLRVSAGDIAIVDMASGRVRTVPLPAEAFARDPSWSPDGSQLLVVLDFSTMLPEGFFQPGKTELWVMDPEGGSGRAIFSVDAESTVLSPTWSPTQDQIAFALETNVSSDIYLINSEGTGLRQLTDHAARDAEPGWSPDGRWIVFVSERDFHGELYVMTSEGESVTRLTETNEEIHHSNPTWGPP